VKVLVLAEGKLKDRALRAWADDYKKRLQRYASVAEVEVKSCSQLVEKIPPDSFVVALEVDGESLSSLEFAGRLESWTSQGRAGVCFLIGGAEGIPSALSSAANARLSLSKMTLPHRLARVVLFEQLYRAFTIQRGEPYARES
jgi:23S rRNA (pseudouridine1915-N3)-methyltransferase